jgi:2-polyprenyl-3-methyl-5-hydroxy-6-metoxy-1,4-benzoquinol methylase
MYFRNKATGTYLKALENGGLNLGDKANDTLWEVFDNIVDGKYVLLNVQYGTALTGTTRAEDFNLNNINQQWEILDAKPGFKALQVQNEWYIEWSTTSNSFVSINHSDNDGSNWTIENA